MTKQSEDIFGKDAKSVERMIFDKMGINENDNVLDGWSCEDGDKKITLKPIGMGFDGKMVQEALDVKREGTKYNNVYGDRIGITIERNEKHFQKLVEIHSLEALNIPEGAEYLEFSFAVADFDLLDGEIKEKIKFGENSFIQPIKAWDTTDSESGAFGEVKDNVITKKISVSWLKTATFPVSTDVTITFGSANVFNSATIFFPSVAALDSTHFVVAYRNDTTSGDAVVGSVSGTTISYGDVNTFNAARTDDAYVAALDSTHFVVAYDNNSTSGDAVVGSVSGTTITYGDVNTFNSADTAKPSVAALDSTHFVVAYRDKGDGDKGMAIVGVVSGTTISSYGTENSFDADITSSIVSALDSTHFVVAYRDANPYYGRAIVGVVSGTTISSYGTMFTFNSAATTAVVTTLDSTHFAIVYSDSVDNYGHVKIGTVSGATISMGSEYTFNSGVISSAFFIAALDSTHIIIPFRNATDTYGYVARGTITGTAVAFDTPSAFNSSATDDTSVATLTDTLFVVAYQDETNSDYGTGIIGELPAPVTDTGFFLMF